jgi:hypothetical protein
MNIHNGSATVTLKSDVTCGLASYAESNGKVGKRRFFKLSSSELEETDRRYRPADSVQSD